MKINDKKLSRLLDNINSLSKLYRIFENLEYADKYLNNITQTDIALSNMISWLNYKTELGSDPDSIELLGKVTLDDNDFYAFKFSKRDFKVKGDMIGISGGYLKNKVSSISTGHTFSNFELVSNDWQKQAFDLIEQISNYWKNRNTN